jgi:hypothetical protein
MSINVLGGFFPVWMLCIIAGIVAAVVARQVLAAIGLDPWLGPRGVWTAGMLLMCNAAAGDDAAARLEEGAHRRLRALPCARRAR